MLLPPEMIRSFERSCRVRKPSGSSAPRSPVCSQIRRSSGIDGGDWTRQRAGLEQHAAERFWPTRRKDQQGRMTQPAEHLVAIEPVQDLDVQGGTPRGVDQRRSSRSVPDHDQRHRETCALHNLDERADAFVPSQFSDE
jgi:hypothetical protein